MKTFFTRSFLPFTMYLAGFLLVINFPLWIFPLNAFRMENPDLIDWSITGFIAAFIGCLFDGLGHYIGWLIDRMFCPSKGSMRQTHKAWFNLIESLKSPNVIKSSCPHCDYSYLADLSRTNKVKCINCGEIFIVERST
jgi:hypothetical protein